MKLLAVSLVELYENSQRYGPQLSAIPHLLSRYNLEFVDENDQVVAVTPGIGSEVNGAGAAATATDSAAVDGADNYPVRSQVVAGEDEMKTES